MNTKKANAKYIIFLVAILALAGIVLATVTFVPETTSPANNNLTNNNTPSFSFNATSSTDAVFNCTLYIDDLPYGTNDSVLNNTLTVIIANDSLGEGLHLWYINCTDSEGNMTEGPFNITIDTVAPIITINTPTQSLNTSDELILVNVTVNGTGSEVSDVRIIIDGTNYSWLAEDFNCSAIEGDSDTFNCLFNATGLGEGMLVLNITGWDGSGEDSGNSNSTEITFNVDRTGPIVALNAPGNNNFTNINNITFNFTATDSIDNNLSCTINWTGNVTSLYADNSSSKTFNATDLADGTYVWYVNCTDESGNSNISVTRNFTIDTVAPVILLISPENDSIWNSSTTPSHLYNVSDTFGPGFNCTFTWSGAHADTESFDGVLNWTEEDAGFLYGQLNENLTWNISCTDRAGNTNTSSTWRYLINDITGPEISGESPDEDDDFDSDTESVTLSVDTDESASCRYDEDEDLDYEDMTHTMASTDDYDLNHSKTSYTVDAGVEYEIYVACIDTNGSESSTVISFSVDEESSSGSGSSSGSAGTIPPASTNPQTSKMWSSLVPGTVGSFIITNADFGIMEIKLEVKTEGTNIKIIVEKLDGKPSTVSSAAGTKVFKYLSLKKENLLDSNVNGVVKIKFKVTKSWLLTNGVDTKNIVLKRYADSKWNELKTTYLNSDDTYAYFDSESPGFSYFAIAEKTTTAPSTPVVRNNTVVNQTTTGTDIESGNALENQSTEAGQTDNNTTGLGIEEGKKPGMSKTGLILVTLIAVLLIVLILLNMTRMKRKPRAIDDGRELEDAKKAEDNRTAEQGE